MVHKKNCLNTSNYQYSGRERSPLGYGYHPTPVPLGTILKGKDGNNYISTYSGSNVKIWEMLYIITDSDSDTCEYDEDLYKENYYTKIDNQKNRNNNFIRDYNRINNNNNNTNNTNNKKKAVKIIRKKKRRNLDVNSNRNIEINTDINT